MSFWSELRRRNVIRMAGLHLVGAWLIVQIAGAGPATYLFFSIQPRLDSLREHPRYAALKSAYESWAADRGKE